MICASQEMLDHIEDLDSLQPMDAAAVAEDVIKILKENLTPQTTELLKNFLRDARKHLKEESPSTSEVSSDENQRRIGTKLLFSSPKEIGKGGNGTVVYAGSYEDRPVAVKRLLQSHHDLADREIELLKKSDDHQNIVRYHGVEYDQNFIYLALERCDCNLDDLIEIAVADFSHQYELVQKDFQYEDDKLFVTFYKEERLEKLKNILGDFKLWNEKNGRPLPLLLNLMRDMVSGLVHLHGLGIIHRDLKPQNVLIKGSPTLCAKLSDMGISRRLLENKSTLSNHNTGCATTGWKACEQLFCKRQTRAMDMFSLGCILFYCITSGRHPFGEHDERDYNIIKDNKKDLFLVQDFPEAYHLFFLLLEADPEKRPKATEILQHPLFWDAKKRLFFLHDTSELLGGKNSTLSRQLNRTARAVFGANPRAQTWDRKLDAKITNQNNPYLNKPYDYSSVRDLLRIIRNMLSHYPQLSKDIQILFGPLYDGMDDYFTTRFPMLLMEVYKFALTDICPGLCKEDEYIKNYF